VVDRSGGGRLGAELSNQGIESRTHAEASDGGVPGSRAFVDAFRQRYRDKSGLRRVDGARKLRGIAIADVFCFRAVRVQVFA
jgi:hypothetical protein